MNQIIQCKTHDTPAVMERLLRTIRVRGFLITHLQMRAHQDHLLVEFQVNGERSIEMLINQLAKLIDVDNVYHSQQQPAELKSA